MSIDENRSLARRLYEEVLNQRRFDLLNDLYRENYVEHAHFPGQPAGLEGLRYRTSALLRAFPDIKWQVEQVVAEGEKVVAHWQFQGTHEAEFRGVPPTGRRMSMSGIDIYRIEEGKIAEHWHAVDVLGLLQQLGVSVTP